jgi:23S rRNA (adenine2503-C2)-methyltransferase
MTDLPKDLRGRLAAEYPILGSRVAETPRSKDTTQKYLLELADGKFVECVLIPAEDGRRTVCLSTQVGCPIACGFCASGLDGLERNLTTAEILDQFLAAKGVTDAHVTNVVFMGMGEPLDNFESTLKALRILQADWGLGIGARRITVSTVGITPKIKEFVKETEGRVRLSVSLHSSDERKRSELVPVSKRYSIRDLLQLLGEIHRELKREITFEYTLLEGVNDTPEEARGVVRIARPLGAKVNLIPYNPIREERFKRPSRERIEHFREILQKGGIRVTVRQTAGREIDAACGQLRLDRAS